MTRLEELARCAYCPRLCRHVCPPLVAEERETVSPTSLLTFLMLERQGALPADQQLAELVAHCVQCGRCTDACVHEAEPWELLREARQMFGTALIQGRPSSAIWAKAPAGGLGQGRERWLLLGSLVGLDPSEIQTALGSDPARSWQFPARGLPDNLYLAWATGIHRAWGEFLSVIRRELEQGGYSGVAWADPHEGRAIRALLDELEWTGASGYAPALLGLVGGEARGCGDLTQRWGCCGAAGGYPQTAPAAARRLAESFVAPAEGRLPGQCLAHLAECGRTGFKSDWSRS